MLARICLIEARLLINSGIYDDEYVDYVVAILQKCKDHKLLVFIDPHQDVVFTLALCPLKYSGHDFPEVLEHHCGLYMPVDSTRPISLPQKQL